MKFRFARRSHGKRSADARWRLRVEPLGERLVLSTFTVTTLLDDVGANDHKLSLREAISLANANPGPDTIVIPAGVLPITQTGASEDANATGDFDITDPVTIMGR